MSSFIEEARKFFAAVEKARSSYWKRHQAGGDAGIATKENEPATKVTTASCWDKLPVELQIAIFSQCRLQDLSNLQLVSRPFYKLIAVNEYTIAREYLRLRRHGSLPSPITESTTHTRAPEDDVVLLSDLFPPEGVRYDARDTYTFRYLSRLRKRQKTCSNLAYYLADQVLDRYIQSDPGIKMLFASKRDRQVFYERGAARLQFKLTPLMFYALYFLESFEQAKLDLQNSLYAAYVAGRLPVPVQPSDRVKKHRDLQIKILQSPPFTDTPTLLSTHHCIRLIATYLHSTIQSDILQPSDNTLISMLLTTGLERIGEFLAAEKSVGNSQRQARKMFMRNMQMDWEARRNDERASKAYGNSEESIKPPPLNEIWFGPMRKEMARRAVMPHQAEDWVIVWEGAKICMNCANCVGVDGWVLEV